MLNKTVEAIQKEFSFSKNLIDPCPMPGSGIGRVIKALKEDITESKNKE